MNEIELIIRYLERHGSKVIDIAYHAEELYCTSLVGTSYYPGIISGFNFMDCFFFGNVTIYAEVSGVVDLANKMIIYTEFQVQLKGGATVVHNMQTMGVAHNMNLMGNGEYVGNKRLYGMGFNRIDVGVEGFGAATLAQAMQVNGYLFRMR